MASAPTHKQQKVRILTKLFVAVTVRAPNSSLAVVAAWLSDSTLVSINEITLRRARLVLGWVTICGQVNHLGL